MWHPTCVMPHRMHVSTYSILYKSIVSTCAHTKLEGVDVSLGQVKMYFAFINVSCEIIILVFMFHSLIHYNKTVT